MSDFEDRLAALDPTAGQPYEHQNLESMISRVTRQSVVTKSRVWRNFQLKMAGALVASALLTTGAIATFSSGPGLAVLAIAGTNHTATNDANARYTAAQVPSSAMQIYEEFNFSAGSGLGSSAPSSPSYLLQIPTNAASEAARLATIFGVSGTPVDTNGDGSDWTIIDAAGNSLNYVNTGVPEWYFGSSSSGTAASSDAASLSTLPSNSSVDAIAQSYVSKLGYDFSLSTPSFSTSTTSRLNTDGSTASAVSTTDVSYNVILDGFSTDEQLNFSVDSNGDVVGASGPAFSIGAPVNYPLQSLQDGVAALNAVQQSKFPIGASTPSAGPSTNAGGSTATTTVPSGPPIVNVTVDSYTMTLGTYQLTDGSVWLLPVYNYAGQVTNVGSTTYTSSWDEIAIDPNYVSISATSTSGPTKGVVNY